jgi:hypothetical protein
MSAEEGDPRNVPSAYVRLTVEIAEARGVRREKLLGGLGVDAAALDEPDARIPLFTYGSIIWRALKLSGDPGLGIEFGLRANLMTHGLVGFGVMNHRTLKEALVFEGKYFGPLRSPGFTSRFFYDGDRGVVEFREAVQFGPLRQYSFDMCLVGFILQPERPPGALPRVAHGSPHRDGEPGDRHPRHAGMRP